MIDPSRITNVAKFLFNATPLPNQPGINPLLGPNLIVPTLIPTTQNTTSIRIDHRITDRDLIFGRLTLGTNDHWLGTTVMLPISIGDYPNAVATSNRHWPNVTGALTWVHTFSSSMTNEVVLNASRDYQWRGSGDKHTNYAGALGPAESLPGGELAQLQQLRPDQPDLHGNVPVRHRGPLLAGQQLRTGRRQRDQDVSNHEFQFGIHVRDEWIGQIRQFHWPDRSTPARMATSLYDPASTAASPQALPLTGFGLANFELGVLNYNASFQRRWYNFRRQEFDPYFQDNWKVTRRLTLNLGLAV